jgi:hypothetical protein
MITNAQKYNTENLSSIFHARFKNLRKLIPNIKQAQLMDYILLGWQTSTYSLSKSKNKWFMKEYPKIVEETGIPLSSLKRYLKEFEDAGFIERRQALYSRSNEGGFVVKKGCYISINQDFINLLKPVNNPKQLDNTEQKQSEETKNVHPKCSNLKQNETFEKLNLSQPYIKDLYFKLSNNINSHNVINNLDKNSLRTDTAINSIEKVLYCDIKEEIPEEIKQLVFGTFVNLIVKHKIFISSPQQVIAEYLYALINNDFFLKNVNCIKHRNNILAKLLKTNSWKTPKGFYKYFYLGENFKEKSKIREEWWTKTKENEIKTASYFINIGHYLNGEKDARLTEIENKMGSVNESIASLKEKLETLSDIDERTQIRIKIEELTNELHQLWDVQKSIEGEVELINQEGLIYSSQDHVA